STSLKELIKKIITEEDMQRPLSDKQIVDILTDRNIRIARRTIAKYRDELKIPPQSQRKRLQPNTSNPYLKGGCNEHHN
ncbi:MAG: hypothetical protein VST72_02940, partial [Nitrospirota bacterium]|nr:hypothetical protein [Nitrospirota bacterium]